MVGLGGLVADIWNSGKSYVFGREEAKARLRLAEIKASASVAQKQLDTKKMMYIGFGLIGVAIVFKMMKG